MKHTFSGRVGQIWTVTSLPFSVNWVDESKVRMAAAGFPDGSLVVELSAESAVKPGTRITVPPAWLEPIDDGREPAEWTAELLKVIEGGNARLALRKERV